MKCNEIMRNTDEKQHKLCQPQQISDELCWQNVGNFIKAKILTAPYQAVRILYGTPDRTRTYTTEVTRS